MAKTPHHMVILLEDDGASADALAMLLRDWGYECIHGANFQAIAEAVAGRADEVSAVIADYHLEDGDTGIEAIRKMAEQGVAAPTLLLTGTLWGAARRAAKVTGYRFMEKPVAPERLRTWLDEQASQSDNIDISGPF